MKQITIISGKGGTGKTTLVASFAALAENVVIADCDVDAPDLHLLLHPEIVKREEFRGSKVAAMDKTKCIECGRCEEACRFNAISNTESGYAVNQARCEGCGVCVFVCEQEAIRLEEHVSGHAFISKTKYGTMAHAQLNIAEEASGKLVTVVRNNSQQVAEEEGSDLILIDGSPGIGCPVIASLTGVDLALVITEPTMSGLHDLVRILDVTRHFGIASTVCINKYDINEENSRKITDFCQEREIAIVKNIPYDSVVTDAMVAGIPVVEFSDCAVSDAIKEIWASIKSTNPSLSPMN
ncbi:MAG: Electron transport complex subunit RsxB [Candidatus Argoarchaeum ethanivorans]|uniref:Electron transport complex subunit RsxB n=1 Tax=Candidatus Argoarchaeum ethanivorans TaxID=2608793 RepID=A0A812A0D7_9EURY|nr:MAG: Electron transport complex subunit RsxB [Candidatus Argoarchaeum ethanivorans]